MKKEYQSLEIQIMTICEDIVTQSYGEIESTKANFDNFVFDEGMVW